jgi:hypothetical protein
VATAFWEYCELNVQRILYLRCLSSSDTYYALQISPDYRQSFNAKPCEDTPVRNNNPRPRTPLKFKFPPSLRTTGSRAGTNMVRPVRLPLCAQIEDMRLAPCQCDPHFGATDRFRGFSLGVFFLRYMEKAFLREPNSLAMDTEADHFSLKKKVHSWPMGA